jgi:hypothetical protein
MVERFARQTGRMVLIDLARPDSKESAKRGGRLVFRERFRRFLTRHYPSWKLAEISAEPDLAHSLSPAFPRAFLRKGNSGAAAIAAPPEGMDASFILSFGLIWLDYLRRREPRLAIERLVLFLPAGGEQITRQRIPYLDPARVRCDVFAYSAADFALRLDPGDCGNLDTKLEVFRWAPPETQAWVDRLKDLPEVECVENNGGSISLRVRGVEFARTAGNELLFGLQKRAAAREHNLEEIERLAAELVSLRSPGSDGPLYRQNPEEWLASQVRASLNVVDASLLPAPISLPLPLADANTDLIYVLFSFSDGVNKSTYDLLPDLIPGQPPYLISSLCCILHRLRKDVGQCESPIFVRDWPARPINVSLSIEHLLE